MTNIITPKALVDDDIDIEWVQFDVDKTKTANPNGVSGNNVGIDNHLYLLGYTNEDIPPPIISQGYRIGSRLGDKVYLEDDTKFAEIFMTDGPVNASNRLRMVLIVRQTLYRCNNINSTEQTRSYHL